MAYLLIYRTIIAVPVPYGVPVDSEAGGARFQAYIEYKLKVLSTRGDGYHGDMQGKMYDA